MRLPLRDVYAALESILEVALASAAGKDLRLNHILGHVCGYLTRESTEQNVYYENILKSFNAFSLALSSMTRNSWIATPLFCSNALL